MISTNNLTLSFAARTLFEDVNIKFLPGNCYGLIGANGAGKSTFLKLLSGEIEPTSGSISIPPHARIAVLNQDQFAFDEYKVVDTVIMGHKKLYKVMMDREAIYSKENFTEEDGIKAADLEADMAELHGWEAESEASSLLESLGIKTELHTKLMKELDNTEKVRVLLGQAIFGNPDILFLDEPTNNLDIESKRWLEDFLDSFANTVIIISHDRHFLNRVCTHIADIDYSTIKIYTGNYDFWFQASQLAIQQRKDANKKKEERISELKEFVQRFSANASKSRQATSRKKVIDSITIDDIGVSSRKRPYIAFKPRRECGSQVLEAKELTKTVDGRVVLNKFNLVLDKEDKIAFIGGDNLAKTTLFQILAGEIKQDAGEYKWGMSIIHSYFPKENSAYFNSDLNLIDWLRQYSEEKEEGYIRGFFGRMLFSGDETKKKVNILSGGERVRCMFSRMMLSGSNALIFDEPVSHLDLEGITSLNQGLTAFPGVILFNTHDHQLIETVANRIIEFTQGGVIDRKMTFEEYLSDKDVNAARDKLNHEHKRMIL